jgi:hypothetical protein
LVCWQGPPFPLIVTGVIDARFSTAAGVAATAAARMAVMAKVFIVKCSAGEDIVVDGRGQGVQLV